MKNRIIQVQFIFLYLFALYACIEQKSSEQEGDVKVINFSEKRNRDIADITENIRVVPLESNDNSIFKEITQIEFTNDHYIILDISTQQILAFDKEGNFDRKIEQRGQAPGEYILPISFTVDEKRSKIYIIDIDNKTICYDLKTFEYLFEHKKTTGMSIIPFNSGFASFNFVSNVINRKTYDEHLIITNDSLEVIDSYLPMEFMSGYIMTPTNRFYKYNDIIYAFPPFSNFIYKLTNNSCDIFYEIKYGNYNLAPLEFIDSKNETDNYIQRLYRTDYIRHFQPFETDKFFLMSYYRKDLKCLGVYSKENGESFYIETPTTESKKDFLHKIVGVDNNKFVSFGHSNELSMDIMDSEEEMPLLIIFDIK